MKIKQRKSLPWRRFGYVIQINIKFGELLPWISLRIINAMRSYIKLLKEYFIRYPNTSKLVKKTRLGLVFSTHFSVFGYLMKHSSSCFIYYNKLQQLRIPFYLWCKCDICFNPKKSQNIFYIDNITLVFPFYESINDVTSLHYVIQTNEMLIF